MQLSFIVDINAGKLAKYLRMMGYDTLLFREQDDGVMVKTALKENRVILTKDGEVLKRRLIIGGRIRAIHLVSDDPRQQVLQVLESLHLRDICSPFSRCLDCNTMLVPEARDSIREMVPPHVFKTQFHYMRCPDCSKIYWRGTHWQAMCRQIELLRI